MRYGVKTDNPSPNISEKYFLLGPSIKFNKGGGLTNISFKG
jgi:hypothetical protein